MLHLDFKGAKARDRSEGGNHGQVEGGKAQTVTGPFGEAMVFKPAPAPKAGEGSDAVRKRRRGKDAQSDKTRKRGKSGGRTFAWTRDMTFMVRAMALADGVLFVAGPEDLVDEDDAFQNYTAPATQKRLAAQAAALAGKSGALMQAVDPETGKAWAEYTLDSPPVFDGMIVAGKNLYLATMDGRIIAFDPQAND